MKICDNLHQKFYRPNPWNLCYKYALETSFNFWLIEFSVASSVRNQNKIQSSLNQGSGNPFIRNLTTDLLPVEIFDFWIRCLPLVELDHNGKLSHPFSHYETYSWFLLLDIIAAWKRIIFGKNWFDCQKTLEKVPFGYFQWGPETPLGKSL